MKRDITLLRTTSHNPDFQRLVKDLDTVLAERNGKANVFFAQYNSIETVKNVVLAYDDDEAIGCGAMKEYDEKTIEIKRMFVSEYKRGNGIASVMLNELEKWASELNYKRCILETGLKMPEAISLYRKNHYQIISNYGPYKNLKSNICFQKLLME